MRGGVSQIRDHPGNAPPSSPRAWGCFHGPAENDLVDVVFPTCVGVFLTVILRKSIALRLPHVRGGVSYTKRPLKKGLRSSPRAWGCFYPEKPFEHRDAVFPTCVGVFLVQKLL